LLFLENRDRKYDNEIYRIRGLYNTQNIDFNLSQFGLFIDNDTLFMTVHINDFIKYIGRKPISGDVIELPHLRDDFALNDFDVSLPRYYVIEDVGRASEGFSVTWFPHLYRLKLKRITDNQQFADIFSQPAKDANGDPVANTTLKDLLSTYNQEIAINNQVVAQAEVDAPASGYETRQFYTLAVDPATGKPFIDHTTDTQQTYTDSTSEDASEGANVPVRSGYTGYLLGDGFPVNGYDFGFGIQFPANPVDNDFFLRADFFPNRLFRFSATQSSWIAVEDSVRMTMTNTDTRATLKTGFINNALYTYTESQATDYVNLTVGATVINTNIDYTAYHTTPYIVLKNNTMQLEYVLAEHTSMVSSYAYSRVTNSGVVKNYTAIRITLPIVDTVQQTIEYAGQWTVTLYNSREAQRQSLTSALKPKADL
jgi:hypothetical protein